MSRHPILYPGFAPIIAIALLALLALGSGIYYGISKRLASPPPAPPPITPAPPLQPTPALTPTPHPPVTNQCIITGCSAEVCAPEPVITTCIARPEYACYRTARCEVQANGECGWTLTPELSSCLDRARRVERPAPAPPPAPTPPLAPSPPPVSPVEPLAPAPALVERSVEADDTGFYPSSTLSVPQGTTVKLTFFVRPTVYFGGLDFRSAKFNTGTVKPGSSTTVEFVADHDLLITSYWPASNTRKADLRLETE